MEVLKQLTLALRLITFLMRSQVTKLRDFNRYIENVSIEG